VENGTEPDIFWNKVLEQEIGTFPNARRIFWPMRCMHCQEAPCKEVCPTGATYQQADGLILIDSAKCIGCKACMVACPYDSRYIFENKKGYFPEGLTPFEAQAYAKHVQGTVQKCTFCAHRLETGLTPFCVDNCITGALIFGDLDDPNSPANKALREARGILRLKEELGTKPSIFYLT
jgi:molybdopterin-containing oxidoreductase family iron-sulfur binding subunit